MPVIYQGKVVAEKHPSCPKCEGGGIRLKDVAGINAVYHCVDCEHEFLARIFRHPVSIRDWKKRRQNR